MDAERTLRGRTAVVGVANTPYRKRGSSDHSALELILQAVLEACADAGIDPREIDGFASYANDRTEGLVVGACLGVREIRWSSLVWGGGGGGVAAAVNSAAAAVATGQADCVVVYRGITEADDGRGSYGKGHFPSGLTAHGVVAPAQICALRTQRMLAVDGVPPSALEALVMASYEHAQRNPDAVAYGHPIDHTIYTDSRWVSEPLRLYDCSRENDAASAIIIVSAERAKDCKSVPAYVLAGVQGAGPNWSESMENDQHYTSAGFHPAMVSRLWESAGVTAGQVDVVQVYENFSGPAVASLIDMGLCPPGASAGEFMQLPNLLAPGGALPINTAGGNIAEGFVHGIGLVTEAVRQIRGCSPNQVPDAQVSLLLGGPMAPLVSATVFGSAATL
ncbi:transporter [Mycolicibacterium neoaurum]|uniref:thiolase C-terminal domain-containing protein n=1 Tax=Mycolicibacterium neoaurum TaxID=1795 RepID=UPI00248CB1DD|nr:transporter [Mycolicibacterium neoaurum]WBP93680.1 transporter [Mycolicibacterium neoaurum]WBS07543.1 transporter [Mycolicibacterium neoaurum]